MTDRQTAYLNMLDSVADILVAHQPVWEGNAACVSFKAELDAAVAGMRECGIAQSIGHQSIEKAKARKALEDKVWLLVKGLKAYATMMSNEVLLSELKITQWSLAKSTELALIGTAKQASDKATQLLASLSAYGVTAAMITDTGAAATAFTALLGHPKAARKSKKDSTLALEEHRKKGVAACKILDVLIPMFESVAPEFVWRYNNGRKVVKPGSRKRALTVRISNAAGAPIAHAMLTIRDEGIKRKSSEKGQVYIQHLHPGVHKLRIDAEGYAMKEVPVTIVERQRGVVEVVM
jgi:hypothetical protein